MYIVVLYIHSWMRYLVLGLGIALLFVCACDRKSGWTDTHERLHFAFIAVLHTQLILGLLLYVWLSPISQAALANLRIAMKDRTLRFFGVEHIATMLVAVVIATVGRLRSKRKAGATRFRSVLVTQSFWLLLTIAAIPWPGHIGRPLFRLLNH